MKDTPRKVYEFAGYWVSVQFDLLRDEEIERDYALWTRSTERKGRWVYAPAGLSFASFLSGAIILGCGVA